jgi:superfamily II DNA/RNA helicase
LQPTKQTGFNHQNDNLSFNEYFESELLEGLDAMGFEKPTPIQEKAIPVILENKDLIACAQTGTGKTAAFLLPIMNKIIKDHSDTIDTLVIVPTRELAIQIDTALQGFAYFTPITSIAIYGGNDGTSYEQEKKALTQGANIIIATPGRLIAHINQGYAKFKTLKHLVLDEADRMLDMGFSDDLNRIISVLPANRQTLLFSATMPPKIRTLADKILKSPEKINIAISKPAERVIQGAYVVHNAQKVELLRQLLTGKKLKSILIFSSTKSKVKELEKELKGLGMNVSAIHSDLTQDQRNEVLRNFRNRKLQILVATDILSRGIDIDSIELVVNFDVPGDAEDYIHRVGRTARAEATGVALTLIGPADQRKFKGIEDLIGDEIKKLPLPPSLGEGPEYKPNERHKEPGRRQWNKSKPKRK